MFLNFFNITKHTSRKHLSPCGFLTWFILVMHFVHTDTHQYPSETVLYFLYQLKKNTQILSTLREYLLEMECLSWTTISSGSDIYADLQFFLNDSFPRLSQFSSVTQSCPTLCNPMDCSMPGLPVLHHISELAQMHVHWVGDAIQPSCPLSSPFSPVLSLSQHQGLF